MKITRKQLAYGIVSIVILIAALTLTLCDALIPLNIWVHPVLTFLFALFVGFGLMCLVLGIAKKSAWYLFLAAILLGLSLFYALIHYIKWWLVLIILVVLWLIVSIFCFLIATHKTESIALNKSSDYKNYVQRKEEKAAADKESAEKEELPQIKSFK